MAFYRQVGEVPPKRHTQFRRPDGGLYYEELVGEEGFSSDSSLLYHRGVPSAIVDARPWELPDQSLTPNAPLLPRHLKLHDLFPGEEHKAVDAVTGGRGDYVIIPRTTTHRWIPTGSEPLRTYAIEANSHIAPPKRYLSRYGQFLEHAPYCERDLRGPGEPLLAEGTDV